MKPYRPALAAARCLLAALATAILLAPAFAQPANGQPASSQPAPAMARNRISLHVGEGRLIHLPSDARNVFVGDAAIADVQSVTPREFYLYGRRPGETTLSATDTGSGVAAQMMLEVSRSTAAAQASLPPGSGVSLGFDGARLVLRGPVGSLGEALSTNATAEAFNPGPLSPLDQTRLPGAQQVTLRVRIAEVSRTTLNQLGINLNVLANPGNFTFGLVTGSFLGQAASSVLGSAAATNFGQVNTGIVSKQVNAQALLNALQSEGLMTTLAEPNLTTISGETAEFLAGGEIPIPVPQALGVTTIDYKRFGVQLEFTPVLLPQQRIALKVHPQVSELSSANAVSIAGVSVPSFVERETETKVEMASGQTLAIAGLFQRTDQNSISKFPVLGDLPVLGALFRSTQYQHSETELVILVTPYISNPVANPAPALPTDRVAGSLPATADVAAGFVAN